MPVMQTHGFLALCYFAVFHLNPSSLLSLMNLFSIFLLAEKLLRQAFL